jgi:2-dehydropantoate 2-reductase
MRDEEGNLTASSLIPHPSSLFVVGAGGIGCAVGYALCAAGLNPVFVDADLNRLSWGNQHGVAVDRQPPLAAHFECFDDWDPPPGAVVILCTKCYDNARVLARLPRDVILLPIQNGFDPALEARGDAVEGIASFVSECEPHRSHTRITRRGRLHIGLRGPNGSWPSAILPLVEALRRHGSFTVKLVPDILPFKYSKLMYNAAISPLAAAAGLDNGQLLSIPRARRPFYELLRENYTILHAAGIVLGKIGPFHPATVQRILARGAMARLLAWAFYPTLRGTYCSMSGDLPRGQTEINYYNGHLIHLAGDRPCPWNQRVYALVKRMERQRLQPGLHVLDELTA